MPTYQAQLDGLLSSTTTEGPIAAAMYTQLYNFLINNSASLGTQLIAQGAGFSYTNQRIMGGTGGGAPSVQATIGAGDPGCGGANSGRKGFAFYIWDVSQGGTSGQWFCVRFNSASVPFDVLVQNFSGSRTREGRPTTTWQGDTSDSVPNQSGYRTNVTQQSSVTDFSVDCPPLSPTPGGNDYTIQTRTEVGTPSSFTEGDFTTTDRTGFFYVGTRTTTDTRFKGGGLAIQIAQRADGVDPWVLGTGSQTGYFIPAGATGVASASSIVPNAPYQWTAGTSSLGIFPLSNSTLGGFHLTSSKNLFPIIPDRGTTGTWNVRYNLIADKDNLLIVTTDATASATPTSYKFCYFGKYDTVKSVRPDYPWTMQVPYVFLATYTAEGNEPTIPAGNALVDSLVRPTTVWGTWKGNDVVEGGSWYPTASLGTAAVMLDLPNRSRDPDLNPNRLIDPPMYDRYSFGLWLTGSGVTTHPGISYLGRLNELIRAVSGLKTHDQTSDLKYAIVGNTQTFTVSTNYGNGNAALRQKMVIPWNGTTLIGANSSAGGLTGSITI